MEEKIRDLYKCNKLIGDDSLVIWHNQVIEKKVDDENNVQSIELFYFMSDPETETAPTNFAEFTSLGKKVVGEDGVALSDVTSWKFEKNVNELLVGSKDKQKMFILPVAYDKAGNNNISNEVIVFKDSYAHNFLPFLTNNYGKIHVVDPRYYNIDLEDYLNKNPNITNAMFINNIQSLNSNLYK